MTSLGHEIAELVGLIYQGVDDPRGFEPLMARLTQASGMEVVAITSMGSQDDTFTTRISAGANDSFIREYEERVRYVDPFTPVAIEAPIGTTHLAADHVFQRREFERTEMYDWMHRMGADDILMAGEKSEERGVLALVGVTSKGVRVQGEHKEMWKVIAPHLFHAVALSRQLARLETENAATRDALEVADFGCIIVDLQGRATWMNSYAALLLERADGLELAPDGSLGAVDPAVRTRFAETLRSAVGVSLGEIAPVRSIFEVSRRGGLRAIEALVSPLVPVRGLPLAPRGGALVILADPEYVDERFADRLQTLYCLTPTEAEIAQWLLSGVPVNRIAEIFGTSVHTVRTQVKTLLRKCNVSSQAELVGTLQRSLARLG